VRLQVETIGSDVRWCSPHLEETTVKISSIAVVTAYTLSGLLALSPAQAKHRHHHHKHHMTMGMGTGGPSGPTMDAGGMDKSRAGARGVSRKPSGE
jgi:hypothetical protein